MRAPVRRVARVAALTVLAILTACDRQELARSPTLYSTGEAERQREWQPTGWDTLWSVGGAADTTVLQPGFLRAGRDGLYLFDLARSQVMALDTTGALRWAYGGKGGGPDEFALVRDLRPDARGHVWVYDPENQRVTELSPAGAALRRVPLGGLERGEHIVPLADSLIAVVTSRDDESIAALSPEGAVAWRRSIPWEGYSRTSRLARQGLVVSDSGRWGFLFIFGDGWFRMDQEPGHAYPFVEHTEFPTVVVRKAPGVRSARLAHPPMSSALSAALQGDTLFVHFGGAGQDQFRAVDRYSWSTGEYLGSYRLPGRVPQIAMSGALHYLYTEDPYPQITAVRRRYVAEGD